MSYKFISKDEVVDSASEARGITTLDIGNCLYGMDKITSFRLGNVGASSASFDITISGINTTLVDDTQLSDDGDNWSSSVSLVLDAGVISDQIYIKHNARAGAVIDSGIIRVHVVES